MRRMESAGLTDIGKIRTVNQDAFFMDDGLGLYVVADGMGGHKAGEVASRLVVDTLRDSLSSGEKEDLPLIDASLSSTANRLLHAIYDANRIIYEASVKNEAFHGMGSTVSTLLFSGDAVIGANVGDSPIYLIHNNSLQEISERHTLAAEHSPEENSEIPPEYHHILTRAIGVHETVTAHICEIPGFAGDILVIGSDGLCNMVSKEEILKAVTTKSPDKACRHLVTLANDRGGEDNITVLIVKVRSTAFRFIPSVKPFVQLLKQAFPSCRSKRPKTSEEFAICRFLP